MSAWKSDRQRIEDVIMSAIFKKLLLSSMKHSQEDLGLARHLYYLQRDIERNIPARLRDRLERLAQTVIRYYNQNQYCLRKDYMITSYLARGLKNARACVMGKGTKHVLYSIEKTLKIGCTQDDEKERMEIITQDRSALKQMPKVLKLLQQEGLF